MYVFEVLRCQNVFPEANNILWRINSGELQRLNLPDCKPYRMVVKNKRVPTNPCYTHPPNRTPVKHYVHYFQFVARSASLFSRRQRCWESIWIRYWNYWRRIRRCRCSYLNRSVDYLVMSTKILFQHLTDKKTKAWGQHGTYYPARQDLWLHQYRGILAPGILEKSDLFYIWFYTGNCNRFCLCTLELLS